MTDIESVYREYFAPVYKYALSLCRNSEMAQDITQETFLKAMKGIDRFRGECSLRVWLCQIAKHEYFDLLKREEKYSPDALPELVTESHEKRLLSKEEAAQLHKRLHELPEPYKEVFSLRVFGELPFAQIAELFGKTESWARVTYHRARIMLKEAVK